MPPVGQALDAARRHVVEGGLVRAAFDHLTRDAFGALPFEALAPVKSMLKRFFSTAPWSTDDDAELAEAVGPGAGRWSRRLDPQLVLDFGWTGGRFWLRVESTAGPAGTETTPSAAGDPLEASFDGPVVPEATPNPRTIRFRLALAHEGPSRWYPSPESVDDARVAPLFSTFGEVANVLVGPDFVAVGLRRAEAWEALLRPVLAAVTREFAAYGRQAAPSGAPQGGPATSGAAGGSSRPGPRVTRLERAWQELGSLRPARPADLARVREAARSPEAARRQVAANLLRESDPAVGAAEWGRMLGDQSRVVRRAVVDAVVDVGREGLRPLLERALDDADAWVRWKALRGLVELGPGPSREAIEARATDADFRVRLEAAAALRGSASLA